MRRLRIPALVLLMGAFARLAWVVLSLHILGTAKRHHLESAWFIFLVVAAGVALAYAGRHYSETSADANPPRHRGVLAATLLGLNFLLYWPAVRLGLFSDDFVLVAGPVFGEWQFVRPLPLVLWKALFPAFGPPGLHALNIGLHTVNSVLVAELSGLIPALARSRGGPWVAALLFATFPASVETIAWPSGVFDAALVTFALLYARLMSSPQPRIRLAALGGLACALLSKETAIVLPVLPLLLMPARGIDRRLSAAAIAIVVLFVAVRLPSVSEVPVPPAFDGYFLKELAGRPFAALALPWTDSELTRNPWLTAVFPQLAIAVLLTAYAASRVRPGALCRAGWVLAAILPLAGFFFVSAELQGSRYLYLPAVGWCLMLAELAFTQPDATQKRVSIILLLMLTMAGAVGIRSHLRTWQAAAELRDMVVQRAIEARDRHACKTASFEGEPDSFAGVYVFRNGLEHAVQARSPGVRGHSDCAFTWSGTEFQLKQ